MMHVPAQPTYGISHFLHSEAHISHLSFVQALIFCMKYEHEAENVDLSLNLCVCVCVCVYTGVEEEEHTPENFYLKMKVLCLHWLHSFKEKKTERVLSRFHFIGDE